MLAPALVTVLALVAALLPLAGNAEARHTPGNKASHTDPVPTVVGQPGRS